MSDFSFFGAFEVESPKRFRFKMHNLTLLTSLGTLKSLRCPFWMLYFEPHTRDSQLK